jgi:alkylation response protein AidB-like acyl-CoA dehydrogenase
MRRNIFEEVHDDFRATARAFFERECVPNVEKWERDGKVSREAWLAAGEHGLIGWEFDEKYGGLGIKDDRLGRHRPRRAERHFDALPEQPDHRRTEGAVAAQVHLG